MKAHSVIFSSDEGVCLYNKNESHDSFGYMWAPSLVDLAVETSGYSQADEDSLTVILENDQCFETSGYVYIKTCDGLRKISKKDCYAEAISILIDGIDKLSCVNGFVKMTSRQKSYLENILLQIFCHSVTIGSSLLLPHISEIDYLNQSDYDTDDIPWKMEISTTSPLWIEAMSKIHFEASCHVNLQYTYSHFCRNFISR